MSTDDIELTRTGSSIDPARATDAQVLAIVALAVRALMTNHINNVNQTTVDIPTPAAAAA